MGCGKHPDSREQPRRHTSDQPGRQQGNNSGDLLMACNVLSDIPISTPLRSWQSSLNEAGGRCTELGPDEHSAMPWRASLSARVTGTQRLPAQLCPAPGSCCRGGHPEGVTLTPGGDRGERSPCARPRGSQGTVLLHSGLEQVPRKHLCTSPKRVTPCSGCAHPASSLRQRDGERGDAALCPPY